MELIAPAVGDGLVGATVGTLVHEFVHASADDEFKDYFTQPSSRAAGLLHGNGQQIPKSGSGGKNVSVDMLEGSGEHSPIDGQGASQTRSLAKHNRVDSTVACPRERMEGYDDNPPNLESTSGTNPVELEVHRLVWHRRHSDTATSIGRIISSASEEAMDMGENDGVFDDNFISVTVMDQSVENYINVDDDNDEQNLFKLLKIDALEY
ncbi:hypothetical protein SCA6_007339 [Theobroma cacao]